MPVTWNINKKKTKKTTDVPVCYTDFAHLQISIYINFPHLHLDTRHSEYIPHKRSVIFLYKSPACIYFALNNWNNLLSFCLFCLAIFNVVFFQTCNNLSHLLFVYPSTLLSE